MSSGELGRPAACESGIPLDRGQSFAACGNGPPLALWEFSCVHEHVSRSWICAYHEGRALAADTGCRACWQAGHNCLMVASPVTGG